MGKVESVILGMFFGFVPVAMKIKFLLQKSHAAFIFRFLGSGATLL